MKRKYILETRVEQKDRNLRNRVGSDLVTFAVDFLDTRVVGVLVRDEESGLNVASVGVFAHAIEHIAI
jgi:hypothetical protein